MCIRVPCLLLCFVSDRGHAFARKGVRNSSSLSDTKKKNADRNKFSVVCCVLVVRLGCGASGRLCAAFINKHKDRTTPATFCVQHTSRHHIVQQTIPHGHPAGQEYLNCTEFQNAVDAHRRYFIVGSDYRRPSTLQIVVRANSLMSPCGN